MDPTRSSHPILSYVLARVPTLSSPKAACPPDLEQPPVHSPSPPAPSASEFELVERMPGLRHPSVLAAMSRAVSDVASGRLALRQLGPRPDHELVDSSRSLLAAAGEPGSGVPQEQVEVGRAVLRLDETHEAYEALLQEAEARLERVYRMAMQGKDLETEGRREEEASGEAEEAGVDEEVVRILKLAEEGKDVETVCLADRQLRHLPDAFGRVRGLLVLDVSRNQLQVVPDAIGGLDSLEELRLASNALVALPDSIGLLSNLKILDVSGNKLRTLPDSISKCRSLVELDASYNVLTYLPTNIGYELVNLRRFRVYLNKLRSLPSSVCEMRSLCLLDAHFNELGGLPPAIGKLTSLETLNLGSNFSDMKGLPSSFGDLLSLRELDLSNNQIHALPDTFGRLDKLERLNLDQNPLVVPPMDVVHRGVEAVKECMAKRWHGTLLEEERKSNAAESPQASTPTAWLTRSVSSLSTWVSDVSGYLTGQEKMEEDPCLDQQL